jgi:DNA replication protein DnaC
VKDYTFDKYEAEEPWQQTIKATAQRFLQDDRNTWFFIGGQSGAGKTHICTAIAVHYIRNGKEVKYMLWRDEITKVKAVVNDPEQYGELMKALKETDVLYIDDLFKGGKGEDGQYKPPTAADINAAFEIINYRYNNPNLITIISSERTLVELNEIDEAIAGRIAERAKESGYCINLKKDKSRNWRMKGVGEI